MVLSQEPHDQEDPPTLKCRSRDVEFDGLKFISETKLIPRR